MLKTFNPSNAALRSKIFTLKEETLANFRPNRESLTPRKMPKEVIRESLFPRKMPK